MERLKLPKVSNLLGRALADKLIRLSPPPRSKLRANPAPSASLLPQGSLSDRLPFPEARAAECVSRPPQTAGNVKSLKDSAGPSCHPPEHHTSYDLNLDEMRALTVQRVKFIVGLPLLKHAIQNRQRKQRILSAEVLLWEKSSPQWTWPQESRGHFLELNAEIH
ncbi:uncharacterized protein [Manis javanica]|uniref:uncharacterized protein isoform X2 n=1 Tax=Manis javanica TaxID=9974 RepID=UPI003C6DB31B